jgi:hypothetical protein
MKRIAWLFLAVLGSVTFMQAQSSNNSMKLSGTICNSACVSRVDNASTCDKDCTDKSGRAVLVDDKGSVKQIADQNQGMCKSHMGKHVKMTAMRSDQPPAAAVPSESQREADLRIIELEDEAP